MPLNIFPDLRSLESRLAELEEEAQKQALANMDIANLRWSWKYSGRVDQLALCSDLAHILAFIGGRGTGKTRTGSEWIRTKVRKGICTMGLVGRTAGDVRDVMVNGPSGILSVFPPSERPVYKPSLRRVEFTNGSYALCFTAEEPGQLRGPGLHYIWADEVAAWDLRPDDSGLNAWDNAVFATREGENPQILMTTTPKRIQFLRDLLAEAEKVARISVYNQASTFDNPHLRNQAEALLAIYGGTKLAMQEIYGQMLDDVEGALWTEDNLNDYRTYDDLNIANFPIRVLGVDPTVADKPGDRCGIVLIGATPQAAPVYKREAYVMGDYTIQGAPKDWVPRVCKVAKEANALVAAESNQGGELVRDAIHSYDPSVRVRLVPATQSKKLRAEPVAMAFEQGRVRMAGRFAELEDEMTTWVPEETAKSPDRVDALVHALAGVVTVAKFKGASGGTARVVNPARSVVLPSALGR